MKHAIVLPCYNEAEVIERFVHELDTVLANISGEHHIFIIDDCSLDDTAEICQKIKTINSTIHVFSLNSNHGHQNAIYQGLLEAQNMEVDRVTVMDADGEDDPNDLDQLLNTQVDIAFAKRGKRREPGWFKLSYVFYKCVFWLVVGKPMHFGNYTTLNRKALDVTLEKGYIHYSAFLSKQKLTKGSVFSDRRKRMGGHSKMNYRSLVMHALRSLVEYSENLLQFMFRTMVLILVILFGVGSYVFYTKVFTKMAVAGWASTLGIGLINAFLICASCFILGVLLLNIQLRQSNRLNTQKKKVR